MSDNNTKYIRNPNFIFRKIIEEMILVPIHQDVADLNSIFTLNDVGAFLWECLVSPVTLQEMVDDILIEYEVPIDVAKRDVNLFIQDLQSFGAIKEI